MAVRVAAQAAEVTTTVKAAGAVADSGAVRVPVAGSYSVARAVESSSTRASGPKPPPSTSSAAPVTVTPVITGFARVAILFTRYAPAGAPVSAQISAGRRGSPPPTSERKNSTTYSMVTALSATYWRSTRSVRPLSFAISSRSGRCPEPVGFGAGLAMLPFSTRIPTTVFAAIRATYGPRAAAGTPWSGRTAGRAPR